MMTYHYQEIAVKSDLEIVQLHKIEIRESVNQHTDAVLSGICTPDACRAMAGRKITVSDGENGVVFAGRIHRLETDTVGDVAHFELWAYSFSRFLDQKPQRRVIQNQSRTYRELLGLVLEPYHVFSDGGACLDAPFPSLLVQDQETDWEFVKRLASQIGREVFLNSASEQVQIFVGLTGEEDELTDARFWKKCYQPESGKEILYIKTRKRYHPGCRLYFQGERHAVKTCGCRLVQGEMVYCLQLEKEKDGGMEAFESLIQEGARLGANVKEIKGNQLRVCFKDEAFFDGRELPWFPYYGIGNNETCFHMPTEGTTVEVLCTGVYGGSAVVTGALRHSLKPGMVRSAADKAMRNEQGNGFVLGEGGIQILADASSQVEFLEDGTVVLNARQVCMEAKEGLVLDSLHGHLQIAAGRKMSVFSGQDGCGQILFDTGGNIRFKSSTGLRYKSSVPANKSSRGKEKAERGLRERTMAAAGVEFLAQSVSGVKVDMSENYIKSRIFNNNERKFCAFSYGENKNGG